jgi:hypothetical protein
MMGHVRGAALRSIARGRIIADVVAHAGGRLTVALDNVPSRWCSSAIPMR